MQEGEKTEEYSVYEDSNPSTSSGQGAEEGGWKAKFKSFLDDKYFVPIVIILIAIIAFSLGRISGIQEKRPPVNVISSDSAPLTTLLQQEGGTGKTTQSAVSPNKIKDQPLQNTATAASAVVGPLNPGGQVVASKNGGKYHYPWCPGAKQISPQNLITFNSIEEARAAGYTPASNCKGLK